MAAGPRNTEAGLNFLYTWGVVLVEGASTSSRPNSTLMKKPGNGRFVLRALAFSLATLVTACATHPTAASELPRLQGTWEGAVVGDKSNQKISITITGDSLHFHRDTNFWFKTTFTLPAGKNPQELHATIKDCAPPKESIG